jgi:hypothetical protein
MQKKPRHYKLIVSAIISGAVLFLAMFTLSFWASFIPFPNWQTWKWGLVAIMVCGWIALILHPMNRKKLKQDFASNPVSLLWTVVGILMFSWGGVRATVGLMATTAAMLPHSSVVYCGIVTEHSEPIESLLRQPHNISIRIPDYGENSENTFYYRRADIDIDGARQGDSILIAGDRVLTGVVVRNMIAVESCSTLTPIKRSQKVYNSELFPYRK